MNLTTIGDLAHSLMLRTRSTGLKQTVSRLTQELSSGQVSDPGARLGGDFSYLNDMDRNLARLQGFAIATGEAAALTGAAQTGLGRLQDLSAALGADLLASVPTHLSTVLSHNSDRAGSDLESALAALNTHVAGRSIFGGIQTDRAPLGGAGTLLSGLRVAIAGLTDADAIRAAAESWFDDPAGFRAAMYAGSDIAMAPIQIGPGQQLDMTLMAGDAAFRDLLRSMALASLATDAALGLDADTQNDLMRRCGEDLLSSQDHLAGLRGGLGFAQARIDEAATRNETERSGFEFARNALLAADPFETATRLEDAQFQLESLYAVTVRSSRLSLLSFLQ